MTRDPRLGIKLGDKRDYPSVTISGAVLPPKPYSIIGLGESYFAVLDQFIKPDKRDALVLELQGIIKEYSTPKKTSSNKEAE